MRRRRGKARSDRVNFLPTCVDQKYFKPETFIILTYEVKKKKRRKTQSLLKNQWPQKKQKQEQTLGMLNPTLMYDFLLELQQ